MTPEQLAEMLKGRLKITTTVATGPDRVPAYQCGMTWSDFRVRVKTVVSFALGGGEVVLCESEDYGEIRRGDVCEGGD